MMKCEKCGVPIRFVVDPYDLPEGVGMAVEHEGRLYCSRCFIRLREQEASARSAEAAPRRKRLQKRCRECGAEVSAVWSGRCRKCWEKEFPRCGYCGAWLPKERGTWGPTLRAIAPLVPAPRDPVDWRSADKAGPIVEDRLMPICLPCALEYHSSPKYRWEWEGCNLVIREEFPPLDEAEAARLREEALRDLAEYMARWGVEPPREAS